MKIFTLTVGALKSNCYLLLNRKSREMIIVDPGDDASYIVEKITKLSAKPVKIIATHGHFDHIMGVFELQHTFNIPFFLHREDLFLIDNYNNSIKYFLGVNVDMPKPIVNKFINSNTKSITFGRINMEIIQTPGHTPGGICLYNRKSNILISGDIIFSGGGVGRTDFSYSSPKKLNTSISEILKLPSETVIYPGHGEASTILREKVYHKGN